MTVAERWNEMPQSERAEVALTLGWKTRVGSLNPTGRRIAKTGWFQLSPAAKAIIERHRYFEWR